MTVSCDEAISLLVSMLVIGDSTLASFWTLEFDGENSSSSIGSLNANVWANVMKMERR